MHSACVRAYDQFEPVHQPNTQAHLPQPHIGRWPLGCGRAQPLADYAESDLRNAPISPIARILVVNHLIPLAQEGRKCNVINLAAQEGRDFKVIHGACLQRR